MIVWERYCVRMSIRLCVYVCMTYKYVRLCVCVYSSTCVCVWDCCECMCVKTWVCKSICKSAGENVCVWIWMCECVRERACITVFERMFMWGMISPKLLLKRLICTSSSSAVPPHNKLPRSQRYWLHLQCKLNSERPCVCRPTQKKADHLRRRKWAKPPALPKPRLLPPSPRITLSRRFCLITGHLWFLSGALIYPNFRYNSLGTDSTRAFWN